MTYLSNIFKYRVSYSYRVGQKSPRLVSILFMGHPIISLDFHVPYML